MFTRNLGRPMLASDVADAFFENIVCETEMYMRDFSLVATVRAMLAPRIGENKISIRYRERSLSHDDLAHNSEKTIIEHLTGDTNRKDSLILINLTGSSSDNEAVISYLDDKFTAMLTSFRAQDDLKAFVSAAMDARFFISEENRTTYIFVSRLSSGKYHFLQALTPRYFPWYFNDGNKPNAEEMALAKSCYQKQADTYERLIAEFAQKYDLRKAKIRMVIGGFEKTAREVQVRNATAEVDRVNDNIADNLSRYTQLCKKREEAIVKLEGLKQLAEGASEGSDLLEFFECNKNLTPVSTEGDSFSFIARGYIENFDVDQYDCCARNPRSSYYTDYTVEPEELRSVESRKLLLDAIFNDDPKLKIRTCGYYTIWLSGDADSQRHYDYPKEYDDCIPNPHLHNHSCLGDQVRYIKEALLRGDMVMAMSQCLASVSSVNTIESATMRPFIRDLINSGKRCIEGPDGTLMNAVEALAWVKANRP